MSQWSLITSIEVYMGLLQVIIALIVIGALLLLVNKYGTGRIHATILSIINVFVIVAVIVWLLSITGVLSALNIPVNYFGK